MEIEEASRESGHVVCGSWIRHPKKVNWAIIAKAAKRRGSASPALLYIYSFDPITTSLSSSPLVNPFSSLTQFWNLKFTDLLKMCMHGLGLERIEINLGCFFSVFWILWKESRVFLFHTHMCILLILRKQD